MKTALFTNFTGEEFIGSWDGKLKPFAPGKSLYLPDLVAQHFAKHLVNRELLKVDASGNLVHKDGDKMTSPKFPEQVPLFQELFNKAYTPDNADEINDPKSDLDDQIAIANKNRETEPNKLIEPKGVQIAEFPPDDEGDEEEFAGKPVETKIPEENK